jgi:YHS domain-containing protein
MADRADHPVFDPICGMWLEPAQVAASYTYIGQTYGFCSAECRDMFARIPDVHALRIAQDAEACIAHCCPHQRDEADDAADSAPSLIRSRRIE